MHTELYSVILRSVKYRPTCLEFFSSTVNFSNIFLVTKYTKYTFKVGSKYSRIQYIRISGTVKINFFLFFFLFLSKNNTIFCGEM